MSSDSRPVGAELREQVIAALRTWPSREARASLLRSCTPADPHRLEVVGRALAQSGRQLGDAAQAFLTRYQSDRRLALRTVVLYARFHQLGHDPRAFLREVRRIASLPGAKPWPAIMDALRRMWARHPREMYQLMPGWLTHRDPWFRWAALHGLEIPALKDPRPALKVIRLLRGERNPRVRRMLGHVLGQGVYPRHPDSAFEEMARWLGDGASSARRVTRIAEEQVGLWFRLGYGNQRQRRQLLRVAAEYEDHRSAAVRAHARRIIRLLEA